MPGRSDSVMDPFSTRASSAKPPKAPNTIGFRAAEPEAAGDRQRHLVAAVREQEAARPAMACEHRERARNIARRRRTAAD
jgi:hypothetical protein